MEHDEQVSYFQWVALMSKRDSRYKNIYAVPNGARTSMSIARRLKKEGLKAGVFDIAIDWPKKKDGQIVCCGLRIEMKWKRNILSPQQRVWKKRYLRAQFRTEVCYSFEEAKEATIEYFKNSA